MLLFLAVLSRIFLLIIKTLSLILHVYNIINLGATEYWQAQASKENALQTGIS